MTSFISRTRHGHVLNLRVVELHTNFVNKASTILLYFLHFVLKFAHVCKDIPRCHFEVSNFSVIKYGCSLIAKIYSLWIK